MKQIILIFIVVVLSFHIGTAQKSWQRVTGIWGGSIRDIQQSNSGLLLASSDGMLFKSTNQGNTWEYFETNIGMMELYGEIFISSNNDFFISHRAGVIRSTDNGANWQHCGFLNISNGIRAWGEDTNGTIFAGTWKDGIYKTTNNGATWNLCSSESLIVHCFFIHKETNTIVAGSQGGIFRSTDDGNSWNFIHVNDQVFFEDIVHIAKDTLLAASSDGVYRSFDNGNSWTAVPLAPVHSNEIILTADGTVVLGTMRGVYLSNDIGITWKYSGLSNESILSIMVTPNGSILVGTLGCGVFVSNDGGKNWSNNSAGINAANIKDIVFDKEGNVYVSTRHKIYKSNDAGLTFSLSYESTNSEIVHASINSKGHVFAIVLDTVISSTNKGESWQIVSSTEIWPPPWNLTADIDDNLLLVTRDNTVYRSTNNGKIWNKMQRLSSSGSDPRIELSKDTCGYISSGPNIFQTYDNGMTWAQNVNTLWTTSITDIAVSIDGDVYVCTAGDGIFRSSDCGFHWINVTSDLQDNWVMFVKTFNNIILVNTWSYYMRPSESVYYSTDKGAAWIHIPMGIINDFITEVDISPSGDFFIGTQSNGLLSDMSPAIVLNNNPVENFTLSQNYPNPFNPHTSIVLELATAKKITIVVYDLLGREIRSIIHDELKTAGIHSFLWNGKNNDGMPISSGMYMCRILIGEESQTLKMVLAR